MAANTEDILDAVIVGGGAAGVLVATHLLHASAGRARLAIVEPAPRLALGAAYSTPRPEHLLNVVAGRMSAFDARPDDFVRYLQARERGTREGAADDVALRFAPRRDYGDYLRETLARQPGRERLDWRNTRAVDLRADADAWDVVLQAGGRLRARAVVLAVGNAPRRFPAPLSGAPGTARADAWDYAAIGAIGADDDIAILGSGLSMVDVVVTLDSAGHRGAIHVVSRHGLLPLPHAAPGPHAGGVEALLALGVRQRMRLIRDWAARRQAEAEPWQWTMDRLRPHGQALWQSLEDVEQRRFLRHAVRYWDIHRHRIAPSIHRRIAALIERGQMQVHAGRASSLQAGDRGGAVLTLALREGGRRTLRVDRLINATGVETRVRRSPNALVGRLLERGIVAAGPHGLGLATDADGRASGPGSPALYTLGSARIGQCWESIAIPELRGQAERIARLVAGAANAPGGASA